VDEGLGLLLSRGGKTESFLDGLENGEFVLGGVDGGGLVDVPRQGTVGGPQPCRHLLQGSSSSLLYLLDAPQRNTTQQNQITETKGKNDKTKKQTKKKVFFLSQKRTSNEKIKRKKNTQRLQSFSFELAKIEFP
jgi:hypothetical protein